MKNTSTHQRARGFTLIELMVSVAIVGLLSSVAIPEYSRVTLRARAAERAMIMESMGRAINDVVTNAQAVPVNSDTHWLGDANPPGTPGTTKRAFAWATRGWDTLPLFVEGNAYYSYSFDVNDPVPTGTSVEMAVVGEGDLDGDGVRNLKTVRYAANGYSFAYVDETPPRGMEDNGSF